MIALLLLLASDELFSCIAANIYPNLSNFKHLRILHLTSSRRFQPWFTHQARKQFARMLRTLTSPQLTTIIFSCIQDRDLSATFRNGHTWIELDDALSRFTTLYSGRLQVVFSFNRPSGGRLTDAECDSLIRSTLEEYYLRGFTLSGGRIDVRTLEQIDASYGCVIRQYVYKC